jgi:hypothetical protein
MMLISLRVSNEAAYNVFHHHSTRKKRIKNYFRVCDILSGVSKQFGSFLIAPCALTASVIDFLPHHFLPCSDRNRSSMLTLSAKSENLVNDFTDLSISDDIHGGDYDSHKVCSFSFFGSNAN